jgi:hypothetical protein
VSQSTQSLPLIDSPDNWEDIRDKIGQILALESAAQVALATAAGRPSPEQWAFNTYVERSAPWEAFRDGGNTTPVVNVWTQRSSTDQSASNRSSRQKHTTRFNIDAYAYAVSEQTAEGHTPGDRAAALVVHRVMRLLRNILMHDKYTYLGMRAGHDLTPATIADWTTYPVVDQDGLTVIVTIRDGSGEAWDGSPQTVTFSGAHTSVAAIVASMDAQLDGCTVTESEGQALITTTATGAGVSIVIGAGTSALVWDSMTRGTDGRVWGRWVSDFEFFQPADGGGRPVQNVIAAQLHLDVDHNEIVDFGVPDVLEIINVTFVRGTDDKVLAELEYDHSGS